MAIPTGPTSRPRRRNAEDAPSQTAPTAQPATAAVAQPAATAPALTLPTPVITATFTPVFERPRLRDSVRQSGRIPSEVFHRDPMLSPAVLALTLPEFFELLYGDEQKIQDLSVDELFRMRDQAAWPDAFTAGDARQLFTEDMCRRGQFAPIGWSADGLAVATSRDDGGQDDLMRALDALVQLPITIYAIRHDAVEAGITWLYRRSQ